MTATITVKQLREELDRLKAGGPEALAVVGIITGWLDEEELPVQADEQEVPEYVLRQIDASLRELIQCSELTVARLR